METNPAFDLTKPEAVTEEEQAAFMGIVSRRFLEFDRTTLMDYYRRMQRAIRKYSDKPIVTGGNIYCSTNIPTGIERLEEGNQIYAPHGYDSVVDSARYESFSKRNVELLYEEKRRGQERLGLPTIVGEWGAFPSEKFTNDLIRHMNGILEKNLWGSAYCEYHPGMESDANFSSLCRTYPAETAGKLEMYRYDEDAQRFEMIFEAEGSGETRIFCSFIPQGVECNLPHSFRIEQLSDRSCCCFLKTDIAGRACVVVK